MITGCKFAKQEEKYINRQQTDRQTQVNRKLTGSEPEVNRKSTASYKPPYPPHLIILPNPHAMYICLWSRQE